MTGSDDAATYMQASRNRRPISDVVLTKRDHKVNNVENNMAKIGGSEATG